MTVCKWLLLVVWTATAGIAVMMWPITTAAERARALSLGCRGLMTSNLRTGPAPLWPGLGQANQVTR